MNDRQKAPQKNQVPWRPCNLSSITYLALTQVPGAKDDEPQYMDDPDYRAR